MSSPRDVLILVQNLSVPFDRRVWMEATALQRAGHRVHVICPRSNQDPDRFSVIEGVRIHRFPLPFEGRGALSLIAEYAWCLAWMGALTLRLSLTNPIRIVHLCNPPDLLFVAAMPARLIRRSRLIFDQHDLCPEVWLAKGGSPRSPIMTALKWMESVTYRLADHVISTNTSYKEMAETRGGCDPRAVTVVRSAPLRSFAIDELRPTRPSAVADRVVYLGTMGAQEGIDLLLEAIRIVRDDLGRPGVRLDLVGSGPERSALEDMAGQLGIAQCVTFHGRLPDSEMREVLISGDLAVNPDKPSTLNSLSSMNKIVEYMALGLPMVQFEGIEGRRTASDASAYVGQPTPGALAQAIASLLDSEADRSAMRAFGIERFRTELCWEEQEPRLLEAYSQVD